MTTLAALSGHTSRVRLGLLVAGVTYRHPSVLAAQAITIDHASGDPATIERKGRLLDELALAAGRDPAAIGRAASLSLSDPWDHVRRTVDAYRSAGVSYLVCGWPSEGRARLEEFVETVMPDLRAD